MADTVSLSVQADLRRVMADLEGLQKKAAAVTQQVKRVGDELDKNLQRNTKQTEAHFERLRDLGRRLADQLRGYFASIASQTAQSLEQVKKNLGLKQQFIDATKGAMELHDVIRKLGGSLDIANDRLSDFQRSLTEAFSKAGFGADAAGRALQGIAGTRVSGEQNAQGYALTSAKLAQAGGQVGQEGEIAKALATVLQTRGIDQNNMKAMEELANSVRGRNPLEKLQGQNETYMAMEPSARGKYGSQTMAGLAAVRKEVGPEMDAFIKKMSQGWLEKLPAAAQGLGKILGPNGIDFDQVRKNSGLLKRLGDDTNASGATLGLAPDEARGLFALFKHADRAQAAQNDARSRGGTLDEDVNQTRGLTENAGAVKNRVGGMIQAPLAKPLGMANDLLNKASQSDLGSIAVMGGGFLAAAAGAAGASKLAAKLGGKGGAGAAVASMAKAGVVEQITGQKTIPVYVVNVAEFGQLGGMPGAPGAPGGASLGGAASKLAKAAEGFMAVSGALAAGLAIGTAANDLLDTHTMGKNKGTDLSGNWVERFFDKLDKGLGGALTGRTQKQLSVGDSDVAKQLERQNEMSKRDRQLTAPSKNRRGTPAASANTEE